MDIKIFGKNMIFYLKHMVSMTTRIALGKEISSINSDYSSKKEFIKLICASP